MRAWEGYKQGTINLHKSFINIMLSSLECCSFFCYAQKILLVSFYDSPKLHYSAITLLPDSSPGFTPPQLPGLQLSPLFFTNYFMGVTSNMEGVLWNMFVFGSIHV